MEEKQRRINSAAVANMAANYLLSLADCDPRPTAAQTKRRTRTGGIYALAMQIGCDLIDEATRGTEQSLVVTVSVESRTLFADNKDKTNFGARVRPSVAEAV